MNFLSTYYHCMNATKKFRPIIQTTKKVELFKHWYAYTYLVVLVDTNRLKAYVTHRHKGDRRIESPWRAKPPLKKQFTLREGKIVELC